MVVPISVGIDNESKYKGTLAGAVLGGAIGVAGQLYTDTVNNANFIDNGSKQVSNKFIKAVTRERDKLAKKDIQHAIKILKECKKRRALPTDTVELNILKNKRVFGKTTPDNLVEAAQKKIKELRVSTLNTIYEMHEKQAQAAMKEKFDVYATPFKREFFQEIFDSGMKGTSTQNQKLVKGAFKHCKIKNATIAGVVGAIILGIVGKVFIDNKIQKNKNN